MSFLFALVDLFDRFVSSFNRNRDRAIQSALKNPLINPLLVRYSANSITYFRALLTLGVIGFLADNWIFRGHNSDFSLPTRTYLLITVCLIGFLDLVDGSWARLRRRLKFNDGATGEHLDPFWDKVFTMSIFLYYFFLLPVTEKFLLGILAAGDTAATGVRYLAKKYQVTIPANSFGKTKMAFQTASVIYLVGFFPLTSDLFKILLSVGLTFGSISVVMHLVSLKFQLAVEKSIAEPEYKEIVRKEP